MNLLSKCAAAAALTALPMAALAGQEYRADLSPLNNSGVSGTAHLMLNDDGTLTVDIMATGLEADINHDQHIHGFLDGTNAVSPPQSAGGDAASPQGTLLSVGEGAPFYGPILLPLEPNSTAPGGIENFSHTYNDSEAASLNASLLAVLGTSLVNSISSIDDLRALDLREIVIHGLTVDGVYQATLPVASGEIYAVPLPASAWMALATVGLIAVPTIRRRLLSA